MKKIRPFKFLPLILLPSIVLGGFVLASTPFVKTDAVHASNYVKSILPSTIYLNDSTEEEIRNYYADLNNKDLNGEDLLKALKPILSKDQKYHSYDVSNGIDIWKMYEITDRDWTLSPADKTETGTYHEDTNSITGYLYGSSSANPGSNPYVHTLYRNRGEEGGNVRAWDLHGKDGGTDREHIWPKSRGFDDDDTGKYGARGDVMHLWSGDHSVNSYLHNNLSYGFVSPTKITKDGATYAPYLEGNYVGVSSTLGESNVFEPQDSDKGDIARSVFYMVARYNNLAGDDDTIDSGNPNLTLTSDTDTATITSTATQAVGIGIIQDLLAWHEMDPVDEYEIHRNNLLFRNYTNNRNPFIDFPEWVNAIWGRSEYDSTAHKVTAYNAAPVGSANPSSDSINGKTLVDLTVTGNLKKKDYKSDETFDTTGLTIAAVYDDDSTLNVTHLVEWEPLVEKMTSITGTYKQGAVTKQVVIEGITVTAPLKLVGLEVKGVPVKVDYKVGDYFDPTGIKVIATFNDKSTQDVSEHVKWDTLSLGTREVKGTYTYKDVTLEVKVSGLTVTKGESNFGMVGIIILVVIAVIAFLILLLMMTKGRRSSKRVAKKIVKQAIGSKGKSSSSKRNSSTKKKK